MSTAAVVVVSATSGAVVPPYLTYLSFGEHCVTLVLKAVSIALMSTLLYWARFRPAILRVTRVSSSMRLYLGTHIVCATVGLPYYMYTVFWWLPPSARSVSGLFVYLFKHNLFVIGT